MAELLPDYSHVRFVFIWAPPRETYLIITKPSAAWLGWRDWTSVVYFDLIIAKTRVEGNDLFGENIIHNMMQTRLVSATPS